MLFSWGQYSKTAGWKNVLDLVSENKRSDLRGGAAVDSKTVESFGMVLQRSGKSGISGNIGFGVYSINNRNY